MLTKQFLLIATLLVGSLWESNSSHRPEAPFCLRASELNILFLEACDPDLLKAGAFLLFRNQLKMFTFRRLFASLQTKAAVAVTSAVWAEHCHSIWVPIVYLSPSHPWPGGSRRRELAFVLGLLLLRIIIYISIHMYSIYWCSVCMYTQSLDLIWLCDPVDCSPPGCSVHGILQARVLGVVAMPFSGGSFWPRNWTRISCIGRWVLYHWAAWEVLI